jgi:hypothetical protein
MGAETLSASDGTLVPSARTIDAPTSPPMAIDGTPSVDRASELKICEREVIASGGAALFGEGIQLYRHAAPWRSRR